jgi:hypothetical protein
VSFVKSSAVSVNEFVAAVCIHAAIWVKFSVECDAVEYLRVFRKSGPHVRP